MKLAGPAAVLFVALIACSGDGNAPADGDGPSTLSGDGLRLMTLNMYLGADVSSLAEVPLLHIPLAVGEMWSALRDSQIPQRVGAMAGAIARLQPHVVALQEVVLIREQIPGDYLADDSVPASTVVWDFLALLREALDAQGQTYRVASARENADIEAPRLDLDGTLADARLTDRDVILVRDGVSFSDAGGGAFDVALEIDPIRIERGYVTATVSYQGRAYRIVNTHLEAADEGPAIRMPQAQQLVDTLAGESQPLILLGDINSPAPNGGAYALLAEAGYRDLWPETGGGATCCHAANLRGDDGLAERIDMIFARNFQVGRVEAVTALDTAAEKTEAGMWPTDHAAVAVCLLP